MNILTFDIEDWFHINFEKKFNDEKLWKSYESRIEKNTDIILEILEEKNIKATFFCLGWVAREYPQLIRKIYKFGHDIGCHSDIHNLISVQNEKEFELDLKKSLNSIEEVIGDKVKIYRAPAFSIGKNNLWAFDKLIENGVEIDCSVFPAKHDFGGFPELKQNIPFIVEHQNMLIKEFPMSTYNILNRQFVLTGGGYFRFFPYNLIKIYMKTSNYNMTYFHPRDFDKEQPLLKDISGIRKFKSYYGLKYSLNKFKNLIDDFKFISVSKADKHLNWDNQKTVKLGTILKTV